MSDSTSQHRLFGFSLRALFVAVTLLCVWMGWNVHIVHKRQAARVAFVDEGWEVRPDRFIVGGPWIRRLLGDEPVGAIYRIHAIPPAHDLSDARACFPEATLYTTGDCIAAIEPDREIDYLRAAPEARAKTIGEIYGGRLPDYPAPPGESAGPISGYPGLD